MSANTRFSINRPDLRRAVSLAELVVCLTILSVLASATVAGLGNTAGVARERVAFSRAQIVDAARRTYALSHRDASRIWLETDPAQRLTLLRNQALLMESDAFLSVPGGFRLDLSGELWEPTRVLSPRQD